MTKPMFISLVALCALGGCGPSLQGTPAACTEIDQAQFDAAIKAGATHAEVKISNDGITDSSTSAGAKACARAGKKSLQVCTRNTDFVISYTLPYGNQRFVIVPKGARYRLNRNARPTTCEILK